MIDYPRCPFELARVLKPGAKAVFCDEALGHNPVLAPIRWVRRRKWSRCGGRPLKYPDISEFGKPFSRTDVAHFNLLLQAKTAFAGQLARRGRLSRSSRSLLKTLEKIDRAFLRACPSLKRYCGAAVVSFVK